MVTRTVTPEAPLPEGPVVLRVPGLTPIVEPGSVRAEPSGGREIVSLRTRLVVPPDAGAPGPALERLRDLDLARQALDAERVHLEWRRNALAQRELKAGLGGARDRFVDPSARAADALAVGGLFATLAADVDRRLAELAEAMLENAREREAAELEAAQATSRERAGEGHPSVEVLVGLSGGAPLDGLAILYAVGAARWWPTASVRLGASGARAEWSLSALVAQATGEDWRDARLGLSTADLVHAARLPVLPSLRIGRAQAPPRTGYRAAPADLDALFGGWDRAMVDLGLTSAPPPSSSRDDSVTRTLFRATAVAQAPLERDEDTPVFTMARPVPGSGAPPAPKSEMAPVPMAAPAPARLAKARRSAAMDAPADLGEDEEDELAYGTGLLDMRMSPAGAAAASAAVVAVDSAIEPADSWLEFDSLQLAEPEDRALRGRLVRSGPQGWGERDAAVAAIEALPGPGLAKDPLETRGHFDARWDADGLADVPSDGRPHRVAVGISEGPGRMKLRTVPREVAEVYREAWLDNPFDFPLLAGPVDVFVEGALVATSPMAAVDRGGVVRLGLGVEERVRVARNVSVEEGTAGLLGGSTAIEHLVTIDLRSSLGHAVQVEVIDRAPVAGEPDVEISVTTRPEASAYDQAERGQPVRGGLRWSVELGAAADARLELRYRVKLPGSSEVVGGNRRD